MAALASKGDCSSCSLRFRHDGFAPMVPGNVTYAVGRQAPVAHWVRRPQSSRTAQVTRMQSRLRFEGQMPTQELKTVAPAADRVLAPEHDVKGMRFAGVVVRTAR